jgi:hypothetical protein
VRKIEILSQVDLPLHGVIEAERAAEILKAFDLRKQTEDWVAEQKKTLLDEIDQLREEAVIDGIREGLAILGEAIDAHRTARMELGDRIVPVLGACIAELLGAFPRDEILRTCINSVLRSAPDEREIVISINENDKAAMLLAVEKINASNGPIPKMVVQISEELAIGECVFYTETDVLNVDIRIMTEQLLQGFADPATLSKLRTSLPGEAA